MKLITIKCDLCKNTEAKTYTFYVGRGLDAAGDTDDFTENLDICDSCAGKLLQRVISDNEYGLNRKLYEYCFSKVK